MQESAGVQSYRHDETGRHLHIDNEGRFYNRKREPIEREQALRHARGDEQKLMRPLTEEQVKGLSDGDKWDYFLPRLKVIDEGLRELSQEHGL